LICAVHAVVGATVGKIVRRRPAAFFAGVASHLICDLLPHKDFDPLVEAPLLAITLSLIGARFGPLSPELIGAAGAVAPDLENAASHVGLLEADKMRFPSHRGDHQHGPKVSSALPQGILAVVCILFLLFSGKKALPQGE
jgi:hypothetical protein